MAKRKTGRRVADDITAGMKAIEAMIASGKRPTEVFTARTIEIPDPSQYSARDVRELRESLHVSQAIFARLLGVSRILVQKWEAGDNIPSPMARRLMDSIQSNPPGWLSAMSEAVAV
jgi:putative transcriptional regulator